MKFGVLALDYDGTIARDGSLDDDVKQAILEVRTHGIAVLLVTGRILSELKEKIGAFDFLDGVVAENGAVLAFPNGQRRLIGRRPPQGFIEELQRRGIEAQAGECVVETDATSAPMILQLIRELELPLVMLFNRSRLMILPQNISKGDGLAEALKSLRLSLHNTLAIGDAENDHDLLERCEVGVAVEWGSAALKGVADQVLGGDGPPAVASFIRQAAQQVRLPPSRIDHHRITLGTLEDGCPLAVAVHGRNILVVGAPRSGKSWITGLICEQLILQGYSTCVIDPEGDYAELESLPGVEVLGGDDPPPDLPDVARALRHSDRSLVIDLSHATYKEKLDYLKVLLPMLAALRRTAGLPHRIVVDEAHYFLHEPNIKQLLDLELGAYIIATYHPSDLHPDLRKHSEVVIVKCTDDPYEVRTLLTMVGKDSWEPQWTAALGTLGVDEAALLPGIEEVGEDLRRFRLMPRLTEHTRHRTKYFDIQLVDHQDFVFTEHGKVVERPARSLRQFLYLLERIPTGSVNGHMQRGDFSRWIYDVFHDHRLASDIRKIEQRYRLAHLSEVREAVTELIRERYEISSDDSGLLNIKLS